MPDCVNLHNNVNFDYGFANLTTNVYLFVWAYLLIHHSKTIVYNIKCVFIHFFTLIHPSVRRFVFIWCTHSCQFIFRHCLLLTMLEHFLNISHCMDDNFQLTNIYPIEVELNDKYHRKILAFRHRIEFLPISRAAHSLLSSFFLNLCILWIALFVLFFFLSPFKNTNKQRNKLKSI